MKCSSLRCTPPLHDNPKEAAEAPRLAIGKWSHERIEHSVVRPAKAKTKSLVEKNTTALGAKHGFDVTYTKDGRVFEPDSIKYFDAFLFETTGDLTKEGGDKQPPMSKEGKAALLEAIAAGKGFVGCHCASDTFHSPGPQWENAPEEKRDPYIRMIGGEFIRQHEALSRRPRFMSSTSPSRARMESWTSISTRNGTH